MELLRPALWIFCLVGFLHANPLGQTSSQTCYKFNLDDLGLKYVHKEVSCDQGVTFTSSSNIKKQHYGDAMALFMEGLSKATESCSDPNTRISDTIEALNYSEKPQSSKTVDPSVLKWEKKQFTDFVTDLENFLQQLNSSSENC